ncbi:hypothetical protein CNYM01_06730 [Colletotrichum nymphaeae SA-01]|uniref:Uncharacterized protein n=1 Tax=Colletotrichum nymphaeae SA-01 TaxID=1460502 RepID=A0A135T106_9PEZI|nr:hypothetical protein CNYM01_06730 [Colletotrichum nymphaeae SA-01]
MRNDAAVTERGLAKQLAMWCHRRDPPFRPARKASDTNVKQPQVLTAVSDQLPPLRRQHRLPDTSKCIAAAHRTAQHDQHPPSALRHRTSPLGLSQSQLITSHAQQPNSISQTRTGIAGHPRIQSSPVLQWSICNVRTNMGRSPLL